MLKLKEGGRCRSHLIKAYINLVATHGDVPRENLSPGILMSEQLFFTHDDGRIVGVCALRHSNEGYHKYLFEGASVPQMYNPDSIETCWLCIHPDYRDKGVWKELRINQLGYLGDRPSHGVIRADNEYVNKSIHKSEHLPVGIDFTTPKIDHKLRLIVRNHDPVYDSEKQFIYAKVN